MYIVLYSGLSSLGASVLHILCWNEANRNILVKQIQFLCTVIYIQLLQSIISSSCKVC